VTAAPLASLYLVAEAFEELAADDYRDAIEAEKNRIRRLPRRRCWHYLNPFPLQQTRREPNV
jgi:hypothetical protein